MNKLKLKMDDNQISIKKLAEILDLSAYRCGEKVSKNKFKVKEVNIILKLLDCKYEDLFYE